MKIFARLTIVVAIFGLLFFVQSQDSASSVKSGKISGPILARRIEPVKPQHLTVSPEAEILRVIVKFKEGSDVRLRGGQLVSMKGASLQKLNDVISTHSAIGASRLIDRPEKSLAKLKEIYQISSGRQLADFNLYYKLDVTDPIEAQNIVNELNRLDIVELAYPEPIMTPAGDIDPPTDDYEPSQFYLQVAPYGVDAYYAKTQPGGDGTGVKIIDIEHAWNEQHEDLEKAIGGTLNGGDDPYGNHGTAVLGEMIGGDNGYGITGICPGADVGMASAGVNGTSEALMMAIDDLQAGDLMLIELHAPGPRYNFQSRPDQLGYVCMEYWQGHFDAFQYAWAKGIIVIEAAGNGAEDFDDPIYELKFDTTFRNSHAIISGAAAPPSGNSGLHLSRLGFSNYGERVNLFGYGREVFTTGYGSYWAGGGDDPYQYYTSTFSGTSSASPIVTGAVACLQGYYKATYGVNLTSDMARDILIATGTVQQGDTTEHIGYLPNLAAAFPAAMPPPSLYTVPKYFDTTLEVGVTATAPLWLFNRSATETLEFSVIGDDSLPKVMPDWLTTAPSAGTILPSDSAELTVTFDATIIPDTTVTYKGILDISWGLTGRALDSMTQVPVFLAIPCTADTLYTVLSGDDPEGPTYNWVEIHDIGTMIPQYSYYNGFGIDPLDDGTAGPFTLPFDFPYFGTNHTQVYVGVNGALSFTDSEINNNGYFGSFEIPGSPCSRVVAVFWNDLFIGYGSGHGDIYYYFSPTNDTAIFEWYQVGNFNSMFDTMTTFQVILTENGDITMQYLEVGETNMENTALIALDEIGCTAHPYLDHGLPVANAIDNFSVVQFDAGLDFIQSGDCNNDGLINIFDATHLISFLYRGGPPPDPMNSGDVNCDSLINIFDVTHLIAFLYSGGPPPCIMMN